MFSWIFKKKTKMAKALNHTILGMLKYDNESNKWVGNYNNKAITLEHEQGALEPNPQLISYAVQIVRDSAWVETNLEKQKSTFAQQQGSLSPMQIKDLASLYIQSMHFYLIKDKGYTYFMLGPDDCEDVWQLELLDDKTFELAVN
ncbi:hypothetical protein [Pseudoalteromonas sp. T1lg48]|uniref:hypothetical protein n=1 Tax=Pseudoalteromonas sp. T1lg48 TaxID=2077100 RepID=UPI000CF7123E|nr:hypothetical protein [Pseudoalteromonas sp. T1lg48]